MTTNMEEVPLSPSKLNSNLKSPTLRVRSPSVKSNIAISRGDDEASIDDDRPKMCVSDGSTITCVFNKKRLFGGSAFALVAVVVIMAVAIATRSDGGSSSSSANHMAKVATVGGGNSNAAVSTANVESAAPPPKVAPVAPKVTPVAPAKQSNFVFKPQAAAGAVAGGAYYGGKSGKSGRSCSSSDFTRRFDPLADDYWHGSGKSGKSGYNNYCSFGSSGKSGKSGGYSSLICDASDAWHSSGKSGKSGYNSFPGFLPDVNKVLQNVRSGCFAVANPTVNYSTNPRQGQGYAGFITPGETYCGQLATVSGIQPRTSPIQRYNINPPDITVNYGDLPLSQTIDSYLFRVGCDESVYSFLLNSEQNFLYGDSNNIPLVVVRVRRILDEDIGTHYSGKSGKSGGGFPEITCPAPGAGPYTPILGASIVPESGFLDLPVGVDAVDANKSGTTGYSLRLATAGLYEVSVINSFRVIAGANEVVGECDPAAGERQPFDYTLKVVPGIIDLS